MTEFAFVLACAMITTPEQDPLKEGLTSQLRTLSINRSPTQWGDRQWLSQTWEVPRHFAKLSRTVSEGYARSVRSMVSNFTRECFEGKRQSQRASDVAEGAFVLYFAEVETKGDPTLLSSAKGFSFARQVSWALAAQERKVTYRTARLRFLAECILYLDESLVPVGERLLTANPNDMLVRSSLSRCYQIRPSSQNLARAQALLEPMLRANPDFVHSVYEKCYLEGTYNIAGLRKSLRQRVRWGQRLKEVLPLRGYYSDIVAMRLPELRRQYFTQGGAEANLLPKVRPGDID
jgi:hypothetical protein